jgi:hypothetical protein
MRDIIKLVGNYLDYKNIESFIDEKKSGGLKESLFLVALAQLVSFIAMALSAWLASIFSPQLGLPMDLLAVVTLVVLAILGIPFFYLFSGFLFLLSKLLGGTGSYTEQTYVFSVVSFAANTVSAPFIVFMHVNDALNFLTTIVLLPLSIYMIYVQYKTLKSVHQMSGLKSFAVIVVYLLMLITFLFSLTVLTMPLPAAS